MSEVNAAAQTAKYRWEYHPANNERIALIDSEGKDAMLATDDSMGDVYLEFKSPEMASLILDALNNYPSALAQLRQAREALHEAKAYILESGHDRTMAPVIEIIDSALTTTAPKETK